MAKLSIFVKRVRVAQLEEAWTVNHVVGRSSLSWVKLTKSLQQAFNSKIAGSFGSRPKLGGLVYHNNIVGTLMIHLSRIGAAWCCQPGRVALCIPPDYTNSSRSGRY